MTSLLKYVALVLVILLMFQSCSDSQNKPKTGAIKGDAYEHSLTNTDKPYTGHSGVNMAGYDCQSNQYLQTSNRVVCIFRG